MSGDDRIEADLQNILSDTGLTDLKYNVNLAYSSEIGATALQENFPMYLGMVLVFLAGYLIIYNIFQISVTADGMTKHQLRTMLVLEGLIYAGLTLIISYLVSALAVGIGVQAMIAGGYSTFHFTLMPLVICTPVLLVFAVLIPCLCFKNIEKHSLVERLRVTE